MQDARSASSQCPQNRARLRTDGRAEGRCVVFEAQWIARPSPSASKRCLPVWGHREWMKIGYPVAIVWMRRDLRFADHTALEHAAQSSSGIVCAFVLDAELLRGPRVGAPIVQFFFDSLAVLREHLRRENSDLALLDGDPAKELTAFAARVGAQAVYFHRDYEPEAIARDERVTRALRAAGLAVHTFTDHVYFGADELVAASGEPFTAYSPYRRRWEARVRE